MHITWLWCGNYEHIQYPNPHFYYSVNHLSKIIVTCRIKAPNCIHHHVQCLLGVASLRWQVATILDFQDSCHVKSIRANISASKPLRRSSLVSNYPRWLEFATFTKWNEYHTQRWKLWWWIAHGKELVLLSIVSTFFWNHAVGHLPTVWCERPNN